MATTQGSGTTMMLAEWAGGYRLGDAPPPVVAKAKLVVLDLLRVVAVGARMPWSRAARKVALELGGNGTSTVLLYGDRLDAARAAFVNGAFGHATDLDDVHVGAMIHAGAAMLPAALAVAERVDAAGPDFLAAAICGYEVAIRTGLAVQPSHFHRGYMSTSTCGALGAAVAAGKLLGLDAVGLAGALGDAASYASGLAQFYRSGSTSKRINAAKPAEAGVLSALLTEAGIWGPSDILEGEAGFFRAFSDTYEQERPFGDLGRGYRLLEVSTKAHAGAGRIQASADAGLALGAEHRLEPEQIEDVEVGIPSVILGRLTHPSPPDLQGAQLSLPFSLAMALALGRSRGPSAALRREDFEAALPSKEIRDLALRVRCVVDPEIEAACVGLEVPSRVTLRLRDGGVLTVRVDHPRGSPHRPFSWEEECALFREVVADALSPERIDAVVELVSRLDLDARPRELTAAFVADRSWLGE